MWQSSSPGFPYPPALRLGAPFPIKSLALSTYVSLQTIHFWVLDKAHFGALEGIPLPAMMPPHQVNSYSLLDPEVSVELSGKADASPAPGLGVCALAAGFYMWLDTIFWLIQAHEMKGIIRCCSVHRPVIHPSQRHHTVLRKLSNIPVIKSKIVLLITQEANKLRNQSWGQGITTLSGKPADLEDGGRTSHRTTLSWRSGSFHSKRWRSKVKHFLGF